MNPIGSLHASIVDEIALQFARAALDGLIIPRVQSPLRLDDDTEPVPDFMALRACQESTASMSGVDGAIV